MFASLRVRNYRLFASGQVVSLTGTWMQRVAQDWLVLQLTHGSATAIGTATALQFLPTLFLSLYGGVLADRFRKRTVLILTQAAMGVLALALGLLVVTHAVVVWHVYLLAFLLGLVTAVDTPTRHALVMELVGARDVANAVSLNSATFNTARIAGTALGGVLIGVIGTGSVLLLNAGSFLAVLSGLVMMRESEMFLGKPVPRSRGQIRAGLAYVRPRPDLLWPIVLVGVVGTFGLNFQMMTALMARNVFHLQATGYGFAASTLAFGSLIGALLAARRPRPRQRLLVGAALAFGVLETVSAFMPTFLTFTLMLIPTGIAVLTLTTAANSTMQLGSSAAMRGRVMSLYVLVFLGGTPIGAEIVGWVAQVAGARWGLVLGGVASALAAIGVAVALARAGGMRALPRGRSLRPEFEEMPQAS